MSDLYLVKCECGWSGYQWQLKKGYVLVAPDEVDPMGKCPSCGRREDDCEWSEMIMPEERTLLDKIGGKTGLLLFGGAVAGVASIYLAVINSQHTWWVLSFTSFVLFVTGRLKRKRQTK